MAADPVALPEGFTLDQPGGLPAGFTLDEPPKAAPARGTAFMGGVNRGLAGVAGLAGDTAENLVNLGIAGFGAARQAATGQPGPDLVSLPGTSRWIADRWQQGGVQTENPSPQDAASRMLHTAGTVAGSSVAPGARLGPTAAAGASAAVAGEVLGPAYAAPAAMLPTAVTAAYGATRAKTLQQEQAQNAQRDATAAEARKAGYVIPPTQTNPSLVNRILEGFAGKITTAQLASSKNQQATNRLAKQSLGLADDAQLTDKALADIRAEAGKAYQAVKDFGGQNNLKFKTDTQYRTELGRIGGDYATAAREFPSIAKNAEMDALKTDLNVAQMSPPAAVELVKKLRADATANYKAFNDPAKQALARAQRSAADAVEGLVERQLLQSKRLDLARDWRNARTVIARAHDVESALNDATGDVSTRVLARIANKGKPLGGGLEKAASFGNAFPKAAQDPAAIGSQPGWSPLDTVASAIYGGLGVAAGGAPGLALAGAVRAVRGALWDYERPLSVWYGLAVV
jgi:hypothetical protein